MKLNKSKSKEKKERKKEHVNQNSGKRGQNIFIFNLLIFIKSFN